MNHTRKAIVLLSGGVDSATALAIAKSDGFSVYAITFNYGQRHDVEITTAKLVAERIGAQHLVFAVDLRVFGGSSLTGPQRVPKGRTVDEMTGIPSTYVPGRNTIFLSLAMAWAEVVGASDIYIGVNAGDYGGYPDCRPEYIAAFQEMANLATKSSVEGKRVLLHAPLVGLSKSDIIRIGLSLGVDYSLTSSCYDPLGSLSCGRCDACVLRKQGFADNGIVEP